jgi:hypothetical protein
MSGQYEGWPKLLHGERSAFQFVSPQAEEGLMDKSTGAARFTLFTSPRLGTNYHGQQWGEVEERLRNPVFFTWILRTDG